MGIFTRDVVFVEAIQVGDWICHIFHSGFLVNFYHGLS